MRIPFQNFFYDIGIFYTTSINFNLFDIKPIYKYGNSPTNDVNINMFKNIETSIFCSNFLDLKMENDRPSRYLEIKSEYQNDIICDLTESITMTSNNMMKVYMFTLYKYENDFLYLLIERKNVSKTTDMKVISTLSGIQINSSIALNYLNSLKR